MPIVNYNSDQNDNTPTPYTALSSSLMYANNELAVAETNEQKDKWKDIINGLEWALKEIDKNISWTSRGTGNYEIQI